MFKGGNAMKKSITLAFILCFVFSFNAQAKNLWEMAQSKSYGEKAPGMLGRGILNAATCFVDIPVQIVKGSQKGKPEFVGAMGGLATGSLCTVLRAASGVIDVATFWIPGFNGLPVSRNYDNCLSASQQPADEPPAYTPPAYAPPVYAPPPAQPSYQQSSGTAVHSTPVAPTESVDSRLKYVKK
jgi:putative exosortase-associated protein (TIGR04073 family)